MSASASPMPSLTPIITGSQTPAASGSHRSGPLHLPTRAMAIPSTAIPSIVSGQAGSMMVTHIGRSRWDA